MVNSKLAAFRVPKQTPHNPVTPPPPPPFDPVIDCQPRLGQGNHAIASTSSRKRKASQDSHGRHLNSSSALTVCEWISVENVDVAGNSAATQSKFAQDSSDAPDGDLSRRKQTRPCRFRVDRPVKKFVDMDCWFLILCYCHPGLLLDLYRDVAPFYRLLRDNPMVWKHSRINWYGDDLPQPPSGLNESQYARLRHGTGCMSCGRSGSRKTYWAFLRRWCKSCFQSKIISLEDAAPLFRDENDQDLSYLQSCLDFACMDSWGNYAGTGPYFAQGWYSVQRSHKIIYLKRDIQRIVGEYTQQSRDDPTRWHAEAGSWAVVKSDAAKHRRRFARDMELWEDRCRTERKQDNSSRKVQRKEYFVSKALELSPPITLQEMELCPSYQRAVAIPREPKNSSWMQLRPKLEMEVEELRRSGATQGRL